MTGGPGDSLLSVRRDFEVDATHVRRMQSQGRWDLLLRHWVAHQNPAALSAALGIVEQRAGYGKEPWDSIGQQLQLIHQNPLRPLRPLAPSIVGTLTDEEKLAIELLMAYCANVLCLLGSRLVSQSTQSSVYAVAGPSADGISTALKQRDDGAVGFLLLLRAAGLASLSAYVLAKADLVSACITYSELVAHEEQLYLPYVALARTNLGEVERSLGNEHAAHSALEEALVIYQSLARRRPDIYERHVAVTLTNLGVLHLSHGDARTAYALFTEASSLRNAGRLEHKYLPASIYADYRALTSADRLGGPEAVLLRRALDSDRDEGRRRTPVALDEGEFDYEWELMEMGRRPTLADSPPDPEDGAGESSERSNVG